MDSLLVQSISVLWRDIVFGQRKMNTVGITKLDQSESQVNWNEA